jgi:ADP-ribose pyrophosphatase
MSKPRRWTALETELLQRCAVFTVSRVRTRSPKTGEAHDFFRIDSSDWCNIVPLTEGGEVVMVKQYRHGAREVTLEIPGGIVDPGETPTEAAARELVEETGYRAEEVVPLGGVNPNPALFGNRLHTFVGYGAKLVGSVENEGTEETAVELVPEPELRRLVLAGRVDHALVVSALHLLDLARAAGVDRIRP